MKRTIFALIAVAMTSLAETTYYVSPTGDGSNPTAGFATGYTDIQTAINAAADGDTVVLDRATFVLTAALTVNKAITLRGAGENWETVLNGNKAQSMSVSVAGALLHNFTITNMGGQWSGSAGITMSKDSIISNIVARQVGNLWTGAGDGTRFPLTIKAGLLTHSWVTNNVMPNNAGVGISGGTMENCYIADNVDRGCSATASYRGIVAVSGSATVRHCTIVNNKSSYGGVYSSSANAKVYNNIIWGNQNDTGIGNWSRSAANISLSNWKGNCTTPVEGMPAGNISDDPLLASDALHFFAASPCHGTADPTYAVDSDITGASRGAWPSVGCIEYEAPDGFDCVISPSAEYAEQPETITLSVLIDGTPTGALSYAWDFNGDGVTDSTVAQPVLSDSGKYYVSVRVTDAAGVSASVSFNREIAVAPAGGFVIHVSPTGDGTDPYAGFATGYSTVQAAVAAAQPGEKVVMDKATFVLTSALTVDKAITLCGAGENWETVLDGNKAQSMTVKASGALLHNFTFTNMGSQWSGAGGLTLSGASVISNVVARQNGNKWDNAGTRFVWTVSAGLITHCWSTNNVMPNNAGFTLSGGTLENCYIADNIDRGRDNRPDYNGIIVLTGAATVRNCTIVNNQSTYGGIYYKNAGGQVYNNIIWGNTIGGTQVNNWVFEGALSQNNWKGNCTTPLCGTAENGNISEPPLLQDDQMHFFLNSPCNGTAVASLAPAFDLEGHERGATPSMGAFEYVAGALACTISATATTVNQPETITLSCAIDGVVVEPLRYTWDLVGDGSLISNEETPSLSAIGIYCPSVTVTDAAGKTATTTFVGSIAIYGWGGAVYVTSTGHETAEPPYATWETAATNIEDVLTFAQTGNEILLDAGTHYVTNTITITKDVTLKGVNGPEVTFVANVANTDRLFNLKAVGAVLEGITVQGGRFLNNWGGAIVLVNRGTVRNCQFLNNLMSGHGAVTASEGSGAVFERLVFRGNCMPGNGWGQGPTCIKLMGSNSKVVNCLFESNTNMVLESATDYYSGVAINVAEQNAQVINCTMANNVAFNSRSSSILGTTQNGTYCEAAVYNCISAGNVRTVDGELVDSNDIGTMPAKQSYNLVWPTTFDYSGYTAILSGDPSFKNPAKGNYRLTAGSPCIDAGVNLDFTEESVDLDGGPRVKHKIVDFGCYEYQADPASIFFIR